MQAAIWISFLVTAIRLSTPLTFAALGGYCSERSGTVNIALEGMMLMGSFCAAVVAYATQSPIWGVAGGIAGAMCMAGLHGLLCIGLKSDQIISGMAINLLAVGIPPVVSKALYEMSGGTPLLPSGARVGSIWGVSPLVASAFVLTALVLCIHKKTKLGQYIRFAGEHPEALQSQGINVRKIRWIGVIASGFFCGLGGAYLSIDHGGGFARNMTAGRGFIALAALIIGRWTPHGALAASLIFGAIEGTQILLQGMTLPSGQTVPVQWIQMLPYVATLAILAGVMGKSKRLVRPPNALGQPF